MSTSKTKTRSWHQLRTAYCAPCAQPYALVTLVAKKGSSYLQPGARMLVNADGQFWGEISAGCLEEQVAGQAVRCIAEKSHALVKIDTRPHYGCYGEITLLIEVIHDKAHFDEMTHSIEQACLNRSTIELETDFSDLSGQTLTQLVPHATPDLDQRVLRQTLLPEIQLIVLGNWPDGQAVRELGNSLGWQNYLYDASAPDFTVEQALTDRQLDSRTAVLVATHTLARDLTCLTGLLPCEAGYVGVIGSRKRRQELSRHLSEHADFRVIEAFADVRCPAGLDLGGEGAGAMALAIVAEVQATLNARNAQPLRRRRQPIHAPEDCL